jgi:hypothetical protein
MNPGRGKRFYFSSKHPDKPLCPPSLLCNRYQSSFPGVQWPGHDADQALPVYEWVELYLYSPHMSSWCGQGKVYFFLFTFPTVNKSLQKSKYRIPLLLDKWSFCSLIKRLGAKQILRILVVCTLPHLVHTNTPLWLTFVLCILRFSLQCNWCQLSGMWYCDTAGSSLSAF